MSFVDVMINEVRLEVFLFNVHLHDIQGSVRVISSKLDCSKAQPFSTHGLHHIIAPKISIAERVFDIAELAEAILLEIPPRDILLDQRVCKQWKAVVESSKTVQKALFLAPSTDAPVFYHGPDTGGKWAISSTDPATTVFEHPLMSMRFGYDRFGTRSIRKEVVTRPESWRRMLVAQPPIEHVHFYYIAPHMGRYGKRWDDPGGGTVDAQSKGLRMSELEAAAGETDVKFDCWLIKGDMSWQPVPWKHVSAKRFLSIMKDREMDAKRRKKDRKSVTKINW